MMKKLFATLGVTGVMVCSLVGAAPQVHATDWLFGNPGGSGATSACQGKAASGSDICDTANKRDLMPAIVNYVNVALVIGAVLAVIMIMVGGIKYIISNGNPQKVTQSKNIVIYSVVGLVITMLAFAIVNFVIAAIK